VWRHTLPLRGAAAARPGRALAALLQTCQAAQRPRRKEGAPGENTFYDHEKLGARLATDILPALSFPGARPSAFALLVAEHNWHTCRSGTTPPCARVLARIGPEEISGALDARGAPI